MAVLHEKIAEKLRDFLHKNLAISQIAMMPLAFKDISVKAMSKRKRGGKFSFGKSVADNGLSVHKHGCSINLRLGKQLVKINKW